MAVSAAKVNPDTVATPASIAANTLPRGTASSAAFVASTDLAAVRAAVLAAAALVEADASAVVADMFLSRKLVGILPVDTGG